MESSMAAYLMVIIIVFIQAPPSTAATYTNHTVGGPAGWFFNATTTTPATNYSSWATAQKTFNLGDYLIFNTSTNETVVQTYNSTTYNNCTADFASDNDTFIFTSGATTFGQALTIAVPLIRVGPNYFFSDALDGDQCLHGMRFEIVVDQGSGLPPNLNQPPPPAYTAPPMAEPPPVFQGGGGGQGESLHNGVVQKLASGYMKVANIWAGLTFLGLVCVF